jgi:Ca2+-binding RTX toxin-like protein
MPRRLLHAAIAAALLVLALPAAALAAGTAGSNAFGDVTYTGDGNANVVKVTSTLGAPPTATVVIAEPGITEGTDTSNLCTAGTDKVTCTLTLGIGRVVRLEGAGGNDELTVDGPAPAQLFGGEGEDRLIGGDGPDAITAGAGSDRLEGRGGNDQLTGDADADVVLGGEGDDSNALDLGDGDQVDLGPGRDAFAVDNRDGTGDVLRGGSGVDLLVYTSKGDPQTPAPFVRVDLARGVLSYDAFTPNPATTDTLESIEDAGEQFAADSGDDVLIGSAASNLLVGGLGNDTIVGGPGTDTLFGDKQFFGVDLLAETTPGGKDTIDAADGFEDRVDCGGDADALTADQFDLPVSTGCESLVTRRLDPFGIAPDVPDVRAPACAPSKLGRKSRRAFLRRGFALTLTCDERAHVDAVSRAGQLVLGEKTMDLAAGSRRVAFRVPRALGRALGRRFKVRLRIDVTDGSGNRATSVASFAVR